jgi:catechol 2,3-dioxygenase-like lactoylglutathione lyase family enzyme
MVPLSEGENTMIDHIGISVSNLETSRSFYEQALAPLGFSIYMTVTEEMTGGHGAHVGFRKGDSQFWIGNGHKPSTGVHVAFAGTRAEVDAFYKAAMAAGATDNGAPGLRPHYHENYYGAFVLDLDGNNVEAVCHAPA